MSTPMAFRALALGIVRWGNSFHWPSVKRKTTFLNYHGVLWRWRKNSICNCLVPTTFENNWTVFSESFVAPFPSFSFTFFLPHTLNLTTLISLSFPFHLSPVKIKDGDCTEETSSSRPPEKLQRNHSLQNSWRLLLTFAPQTIHSKLMLISLSRCNFYLN